MFYIDMTKRHALIFAYDMTYGHDLIFAYAMTGKSTWSSIFVVV